MPPYVSVVLPDINTTHPTKLYFPIDVLTALDAKSSKWYWDAACDDAFDLANDNQSLRLCTSLLGPSVQLDDSSWDLRGWDA